MGDITVVIPVKDEAKNLPVCLSRLAGFAQIVVVDSGSTDATCVIAEEAGVEVLHFQWDGQFPKKRNWTLRNYTFETQWVLFLDADEFVSEAFKAELAEALANTAHTGFWLNYERWFLGRQLKHGDEFNKLALFKVGTGEYERIDENQWSSLDMEIHEHPVLEGSIGEIKAAIEHNEYRGLHHYIAKHNEYSSWEACRYLRLMHSRSEPTQSSAIRDQPLQQSCSEWENLTDRQRKKYQHITKWWAAPVYFIRGYILKGGFLDGAAGLHFALMKAVYFYQIRLKIRERISNGE